MNQIQPTKAVLEQLRLRGKKVTTTSTGYMATCPTHNDQTPSLSITESHDNNVLLHCHAGCKPENIVAELGLTMSDLFPERTGTHSRRELVTYTYQDEQGKPLFEVVRFDPKDFRQRKPDGTWSTQGVRRVLYRLPRVIDAVQVSHSVYICEGEKDVHSIEKVGGVATCNPGGTGSGKVWADPAFTKPLANARVVIIADNDGPGRKHAQRTAAGLSKVAATIRNVLPASDKDATDHINAGYTLDQFVEWDPANTATSSDGCDDVTICDDDSPIKPVKKSQASKLIEIAAKHELFHSPDGTAYARVKVGQTRLTLPVSSQKYRQQLQRAFYAQHETGAGKNGVDEAVATICAQARFDGPEHPVAVRVARLENNIYIDLANDAGEAIKITPSGWSIEADHDVRFIRHEGMLSLPHPQKPGDLKSILKFVNVASANAFVLLGGFLIAQCIPDIPCPLLAISGPQGSGKSTATEFIRSVIDPNTTTTRSLPTGQDAERQLYIGASRSRVQAFDNISTINDNLSDAICRLVTGGGYAIRQLYTDADELAFSFQRPIILNGITDLTTRPDLLDRSTILTLEALSPTKRGYSEDLQNEFTQHHPKILGGICDAISCALFNINEVNLTTKSRMADAERWICAAEAALPWNPGAYSAALAKNRAESHEIALDASPFAGTVQEFMHERTNWRGTATQLRTQLISFNNGTGVPRSPQGVSNQLRRLTTNLESIGINCTFERESGSGRKIINLVNTKNIVTDRHIVTPPIPRQIAKSPPCPYPNHRPTDWRTPNGKSICGTCHPNPNQAVTKESKVTT